MELYELREIAWRLQAKRAAAMMQASMSAGAAARLVSRSGEGATVAPVQ